MGAAWPWVFLERAREDPRGARILTGCGRNHASSAQCALPLVPRSDATVGLEVAVPFLHERHGETHYRGVVSAIRAHSYLVKFPEVDGKWTRPWTVADDRLFSIAGA